MIETLVARDLRSLEWGWVAVHVCSRALRNLVALATAPRPRPASATGVLEPMAAFESFLACVQGSIFAGAATAEPLPVAPPPAPSPEEPAAPPTAAAEASAPTWWEEPEVSTVPAAAAVEESEPFAILLDTLVAAAAASSSATEAAAPSSSSWEAAGVGDGGGEEEPAEDVDEGDGDFGAEEPAPGAVEAWVEFLEGGLDGERPPKKRRPPRGGWSGLSGGV